MVRRRGQTLALVLVVTLVTLFAGPGSVLAQMDPGGVPHYFGPYPNWAYSPLPKGPVTSVTLTGGGSGYTAPVVAIDDVYGTGGGATASATVVAGTVYSITLTALGANYSAPVVTITDATGSGATATATIGGALTGGIRKFVDRLPGLTPAGANLLGQYMPVAVADQASYPGPNPPASDYYEIALVEYDERMHSDLPPTRQRGYVQLETPANAGVSRHIPLPNGSFGVDDPHYLGPAIVARRDRPVRIKFVNLLPTGAGGNLFLPVDTSIMGAGMTPDGMEEYTQNRATVHLHGNNSVWISDGTPHQWITPAGETTSYPRGVSVVDVPDMPASAAGEMTFYYSNAHSARLMFYHDHALGITRLNVYAGEAAGYLVTDDVEADMIDGTNFTGVNPANASVLPDLGLPLIIQDRTWVDASTIAYQDPTWNWGTTPPVPHTGDLWYPHVYMPAQNPWDPSGMNAFGRWHYAAWFWPPPVMEFPPIPNPYCLPTPPNPPLSEAYDCSASPGEPPYMPDIPNPSAAGEAFMDTPVVNGTAYPYLEVQPRAYRFRILNAADDRFFNLQLYVAVDKNSVQPPLLPYLCDGAQATVANCTELKMDPAIATPGWPESWPTDGRAGGVPDPATAGPPFIQIGTEGGFLPVPVIVPNQPIIFNVNPTTFNFGNVSGHGLLLGTAERADVIVDFSAYAGKTLILYNDAPAAFPAAVPVYDYYTGNPDQMDAGGSPTTQPGYGPNTRTIMQIRVANTPPAPAYDLAALESVFAKTAGKRGVFEVSQDEIIVPFEAYDSAYDKSFPEDSFVRQSQSSHVFETVSGATVEVPLQPKALQDEMGEVFDEHGRMEVMLGLQLPLTVPGGQTFIMYGYSSPPVEIVKGSVVGTQIGSADDGTQIWMITHNGVDTHTIHVHLFNAQLVNRVAWDGAVFPPDPNELGWKETFRVNPLEHTIIALRPFLPSPAQVPFDVPNSVRLIDPTQPDGATLMGGPGGFLDPNGQPVEITNHYVNFGWEYVYHCHLLAHEEMDMMHSVAFVVPPKAPTGLTATPDPLFAPITLAWTDNSANETGFTIERAADAAFDLDRTIFSVGENVTSFIDPSPVPSTTYYYRVFATNTVGDTLTPGFPVTTMASGFSNTALVDSVAGATVPDAPVIGTAVADIRQATVAFSAPAIDGGSPISSYTVTSLPGNVTASGPTTPITVTGLANGTTYTFTVTATNAAGTSLPSAASNAVTTPNVPGAPTGAGALSGNAEATIFFTAPALDGGRPITSYTVTSSPGGITAAGVASPITVTGLANGTPYSFTITATNAVGTGLPSLPTNTTTPATVPGQPTAVGALAGNAQATVFFTAPASDGGNPVITYTVTSAPDGVLAVGLTSPILVTGLSNGTSYTFTVTATNALGTSLPSAASAPVTPATLPGAPTIGAASGGNAQASVAFSAPLSDGGSPIIVYTATSNPGGISALGLGSPILVTGLANGTAYTFTVAATNSIGVGPASAASNAVTPATVPDAPTIGAVTGGNAQASVSFTAPAFDGGSAILDYTVTSSPGNFTATGAASPIVVTGLANGTAYTFTVTARNAVGSSLPSGDSTSVTPATVPDAPTIGFAVGGDAQAIVSFSGPAFDGGSAILDYTVTSSPGGVTATGAGDPITVTGLINGTTYTFTVTARNAVGSSAASAASAPVFLARVPDAPTIGVAAGGNAQATVSFTPPAYDGGSAIITYTATSAPGGFTAMGSASPLTVLGLANGTAYTFTVTATNAVGASAPSAASNSVTPATVPGAPSGVGAVGGNAQASVFFSAPGSNGGSAILDYTVTSSPGGITAVGTASPITVAGLANGIAYTFTVTARNLVGPGAPSAASNSVTPATVPDAPTIGTAVRGNALAIVSFTQPAFNGGSPITSYTVTSNPGGISATGTASPITVTGLANGTPYTFIVTTANIAGTSAPSAASNSVTPATVPDAPVIGTATGGVGQASVSFTTPAFDGGSPITLYTVTSAPGGITAAGAASPIAVTGLANGTAYTFTVTATNAVGTGAPSAASGSVTPATVPNAPTIGAATRGNGQATVAFAAPFFDGGSPITLYTVTSNPGGITATGGASPITVAGLANGTAYTFTVTATNAVGTGAPSAATTSVTPATVPDAPVIGTATGGVGQASVSFTAPAFNGGSPITLYTVTSAPGGITATGAVSPITVTGLANGMPYTFTVTATNAVGTGPASSPSVPVTPASVPGAPTAVQAFGGNARAQVNFAPPAFNGGTPVTFYTVTASPGGMTAMGTASPILVTGLANGTTYAFTVTASNAVGTGPGAISNAVRPSILPAGPTNLAVIGATRNSITLSWTDNSLNESGFLIYRRPPGGTFVQVARRSASTANPPGVVTFTNTMLAPGRTYEYRVRAFNSNGNSAISNSAFGTTLP